MKAPSIGGLTRSVLFLTLTVFIVITASSLRLAERGITQLQGPTGQGPVVGISLDNSGRYGLTICGYRLDKDALTAAAKARLVQEIYSWCSNMISQAADFTERLKHYFHRLWK